VTIDNSPFESGIYRRFREIIAEQNGRVGLVIDHIDGPADLLEKIPPRDHAVFLCVAMDLEISNGDISQMFANQTGGYWRETIEELERLGASELATLLRSAASGFPSGQLHRIQETRMEQLAAAVSAEYERYDKEYWSLNDLYQRLYKHDLSSREDSP